MRAIDLFCGAGGMTLGFQRAGHDVVAAFDNWDAARIVYEKNFDHPFITSDLSDINHVLEFLEDSKAELIFGGPPCQDFSSAGKRDEGLGRANLTISFARIVTGHRPRWFVMENVQRAQKSYTMGEARRLLSEAGYGLTERVIDASRCGVPQKRKRLFIIGYLGGSDDEFGTKLDEGLSDHSTTIREYFNNELTIDHYYRHPRSYKRRGIFSIDEPSPTIRGVNRPIPNGYPGHHGDTASLTSELRPLTTKERALIQTFPEEYIWEGTKTNVEQLIGNAVPVLLAEYVARMIINQERSNINNPT